MPAVAVAASSPMAAEGGARTAAMGGNAVDAAVAATLVSLTTETAVASLGGGAFVTLSPPGGEPYTIDAYVEMPGRRAGPDRFGGGLRTVRFSYGGGLATTVGHGSVATPGSLAGLEEAWKREGSLPWSRLLEPAIGWAMDGFPLTPAAHHYLVHSHEAVFGWHPECRRALHREDGSLRDAGERIRIDGLADTLETIAHEGPRAFYEGELAERIATHVYDNGGLLSPEDLASYEARVREPLHAQVGGWRVSTNPPPAIGGAAMVAMLLLMGGEPRGSWSPAALRRQIRVQEAILEYRHRDVDRSDDLIRDVGALLDPATLEVLGRRVESASTVHTSTVDSEGRACAISASTGYGSGVVPPGTGVFLNNCLGEHELNKRGLHAWQVGERLPSNMAPTLAHAPDGSILAVGSPGADRITTAILQILVNFLNLEMTLEEAIAHPRLHVERVDGRTVVAYEPGLPVDELGVECRAFDSISMFFGGVGAALRRRGDRFTAASDPRREGGTALHIPDTAT